MPLRHIIALGEAKDKQKRQEERQRKLEDSAPQQQLQGVRMLQFF